MDSNTIKARLADILRFDCKPENIKFNDLPNGAIEANLDCYALTASAAGDIAALARETERPCIITIQSIEIPTLQIRL